MSEPNHDVPRSYRKAAIVALSCLLATSCVAIGPTVQVSPGPDKSPAAFAADRTYCGHLTDQKLQPLADQMNGAAATTDQVASNNQRIQADYDSTYGECMASRGDVVPSAAPSGGSVPAVADGAVQPAGSGAAADASGLPIQSGRWTQAGSCADPSANDSADRRMFSVGETDTAHDRCRITVRQVNGSRFTTRLACQDSGGGEDYGPVAEMSVVVTVISASMIRWESLDPGSEPATYRYCGAV